MLGSDQSEEAVSPRADPRAVLDVLGRPVALRRLEVPTVEERVKSLEGESLVSRFLFEIPCHLCTPSEPLWPLYIVERGYPRKPPLTHWVTMDSNSGARSSQKQ